MQDILATIVKLMQVEGSDELDLFYWDREKQCHDRVALMAAIYISKPFQEFLGSLNFVLPLQHYVHWFDYKGKKQKAADAGASQGSKAKASKGKAKADKVGGCEYFVHKLSEHHSTLRGRLVGNIVLLAHAMQYALHVVSIHEPRVCFKFLDWLCVMQLVTRCHHAYRGTCFCVKWATPSLRQ